MDDGGMDAGGGEDVGMNQDFGGDVLDQVDTGAGEEQGGMEGEGGDAKGPSAGAGTATSLAIAGGTMGVLFAKHSKDKERKTLAWKALFKTPILSGFRMLRRHKDSYHPMVKVRNRCCFAISSEPTSGFIALVDRGAPKTEREVVPWRESASLAHACCFSQPKVKSGSPFLFNTNFRHILSVSASFITIVSAFLAGDSVWHIAPAVGFQLLLFGNSMLRRCWGCRHRLPLDYQRYHGLWTAAMLDVQDFEGMVPIWALQWWEMTHLLLCGMYVYVTLAFESQIPEDSNFWDASADCKNPDMCVARRSCVFALCTFAGTSFLHAISLVWQVGSEPSDCVSVLP